jgi:hypothetical protein
MRPSFLFAHCNERRRFGRTHPSGCLRPQICAAPIDQLRRAALRVLRALGRLADTPRRVRPRRWFLRIARFCVARFCVARFCVDLAALRFAILAMASLSLSFPDASGFFCPKRIDNRRACYGESES